VKRFLLYWRPWLLLAVCLGGIGAFLVFNLQRERVAIESVERERLATQSKVVEDNLTRQLVAINLALESVRVDLPFWAAQPDGRERAIHWLKSINASMPSVLTFLVTDAKGIVTLSDREELIGFNASQREYFQAPLRSSSPKTFFVSSPYRTTLGNFVINVTRAIVGPGGGFAGVVSATVDPVDVQILLNSVRYAADMRSMLVHGDGRIFVSQPAVPDAMDKNLSVPGSFFTQHRDSNRPVSYFEGIVASTGDERLPVLRTIQPPALAMDKPLVVALSRESDAMFAPWSRDVRNLLLAYLLLALLSSAGMHLYLQQRAQRRASAQRLKLATEAAGVGIWEFDLNRRRYYWDMAMFALFGLDPSTVNALNNDWRQLLLPGELQRVKEATRATLKQGQSFDLTFQIRRPDGQLRYLRNRAAMHDDGTGTSTRMIGTTEDVTERKMREADLRIAAAAFESHESTIIADEKTVILRVNHAFSKLFGYTAEEAVGQKTRILQSSRHAPVFYAAMWERIGRDGIWQGEIWDRRKNGEVFPSWMSITAVRNDEGVVTHFVATHTDITLRKAAEEKIHLLAYYDPLTRLPNRRLLHDRLHQAVIRAKRDGSRLALVFIDLDKFKPVNDEFGHQAGDELLLAVAHRLQACVRESDTVARMGGDEFVVLLPSIDAAENALWVAEKIHAALREPFTFSDGGTVSISSSAGIALYPDHALDEATLTSHADAAMYQAKAAGRDRFVLFQPQTEGSIGGTP
jgi:diguanylate cyclase (GGDEF)-like protein/PAS domain S-box-containing protein